MGRFIFLGVLAVLILSLWAFSKLDSARRDSVRASNLVRDAAVAARELVRSGEPTITDDQVKAATKDFLIRFEWFAIHPGPSNTGVPRFEAKKGCLSRDRHRLAENYMATTSALWKKGEPGQWSVSYNAPARHVAKNSMWREIPIWSALVSTNAGVWRLDHLNRYDIPPDHALHIVP